MNGTIFVVDEDPAVRDGLRAMLEAHDYRVAEFPTAEDFLAHYDPGQPGCLLLDLQLPGISGTDLQEKLAALDIRVPIIFLTGHGDVASSVRALKSGAVDFLEKPPTKEVLLDRLQAALAIDTKRRERDAARLQTAARFATLTSREREVMALVIDGLSNKQIARQMDISHRTVEIHRSRILQKMEADSVIKLVDMARHCCFPYRDSVEPAAGKSASASACCGSKQ